MLRKLKSLCVPLLCALLALALAAGPSPAAAKKAKTPSKGPARTVTQAAKKQAPKTAQASRMFDLFWKRSWAAMEELYTKEKGKNTARDHALMANAYRLQNKWREAVAVLEAHGKDMPAELRPYADMTLLLGLENLKRNKDALALAERLWKSAPQDLKYYVALAQYRLVKDGKDAKAAETALTRMLQAAGTEERKIYALSRLVALPTGTSPEGRNRTESALKLLELQPSNKAAASVLARHKTPWPANVRVALGVYAFLAGDNKAASERLSPVALNAAGGRKAAYYRAWSLSRQKQNKEALNLWGALALSGNGYAESAVRRIANLAKDKGMMESCLAALERIARERKGNVQARALLSLGSLLKDSARRQAIDAQVLQSFPNTTYAFNVLWRRGWANMNAGKPAEAAKLWKLADAPGVTYYRRARILYWLAQAQKAAGQKAEADKNLALLARKYPLSIYGLLVRPDFRLVDGDNPNLALQPSQLELWGFVHYARLRLSRPKATARELYRALKLSRWLGLEESYTEARRLETLMTSGATLYRNDLEALYPRPYRAQVEAAARDYGVEPAFVWAIMRQESAFRADAKSHVGASGLMQLMPATAKDESTRAGLATYDVMNVNDNIRLGTSHLATLAKSFSRKEWIMAAYNAGGGNARKWLKDGGNNLALDRWIEAIRFEETCGYVQRVSANLEIYRRLYGSGGTK